MKKITKGAVRVCIISLLLTVALSSLSILIGIRKISASDKQGEGQNEETVSISLQQESNPFDIPLENYEDLYEKLTQDAEFEYYECYAQYLEEFPQEMRFFDYESGMLKAGCEAAQCIQVSENVQSIAKLDTLEGRLFEEKDFEAAGGTLPVLVGYGYQDSMPVGSEFTASYLYQKYTFQVVGILSEGAAIDALGENLSLDKYIVMPSFNLSSVDAETDGLKIHYANKTSGIAVSDKADFCEEWKAIKALLSESGCGEYEMNATPTKYNIQAKTGISIVGWTILLSILFLASLGISGIWLCHLRQNRICGYMDLVGCYLLFYSIHRVLLSQLYPKISWLLLLIFGIVFLIFLRYNESVHNRKD